MEWRPEADVRRVGDRNRVFLSRFDLPEKHKTAEYYYLK